MKELEVLVGDSLKLLPSLKSESIQCCVTSPPYWGLRDYDHSAQIGSEPSPIDYVANLVRLFREVKRTLRDDGTLWLNIGDGYARARVLERNGYTCQMCGLAAGDPDPFNPGRTVRLTMGHILDKSKGGDDSPQNLRAICTNCNEGLQNTALPKPDRIHLLAQIRRATINDQQAALEWLLRKFRKQLAE